MFYERVLREVITHIINRWVFTGENCVVSKIQCVFKKQGVLHSKNPNTYCAKGHNEYSTRINPKLGG